MDPRDLAAYGGPFQDARPQSDPLTQVAAESLNLALDDLAQLTRMKWKVAARFTTDGATNPSVVDYGQTLWGTGNTFKPTVEHTATGVWTVTFAASYEDGLSVTETLSLTDADAKQERLASGFTPRLVYARASANTVLVYVYDTSSNLTDTTGDRITVWGW
jgi:hypothetical protein